jgi:multisubunit Na+/H+ antiporter MnhF subunit
MDLNKLTTGDRVIAVSGIVLLIVSFFDWLGAEADVGPFSVSDAGNAWDFTLPMLAVLIGIAMVVLVSLRAFGVALPDTVPWGLILLIMGGVAVFFVLIKLIVGPNIDTGGVDVDVSKTREFGIFLGLIASAGLAAGGYLRFQEEQGASPAAPPPSAPPTV